MSCSSVLKQRYDFLILQRIPTEDRIAVPLADDPLGVGSNDRVRLGSNALYAQATTHWNDRFRTVLGVREDYQRGTDVGTNYGTRARRCSNPRPA